MSIIEKALSKKRDSRNSRIEGTDREDASSVAENVGGGEPASHVEQAMDRHRARSAEAGNGIGEFESNAVPGKAEEHESAEPLAAPVTRRSVTISRGRLDDLGLLNPDGGHAQVAEEFRLVKRPVLKNAFATGEDAVKRGNLVMVTSALPREGKTFCAINLAISIAMEFDRTVLLVDADVARPSILEYLGVENDGPGLLDLLSSDEVDVPDVLIRTDIENLTLLPAGRTHPRANEVLASKDMETLVAEMSSRYPDRIILFDTPPLLATSEATVLAGHMGQVVFVVEADTTPQDATVRGVEQLQDCGIILPLLNKARPLPGMRYAQGYYGSYHKTGS